MHIAWTMPLQDVCWSSFIVRMLYKDIILVTHFVTTLLLLSPMLLVEPWRLEGRCVRPGRNESQRRLSSAVSPVYSTRTNMHFDTMRSIQRSFVHSTTMSPLYRVPAVFAPRDSEPARRGDRLLSHVEMSGHETLTRKKNKNATQYIHRLIYYHRQLA